MARSAAGLATSDEAEGDGSFLADGMTKSVNGGRAGAGGGDGGVAGVGGVGGGEGATTTNGSTREAKEGGGEDGLESGWPLESSASHERGVGGA